MTNMLKGLFLIFVSLVAITLGINSALAIGSETNFNPNNIISNEEMMDNTSMTLAEIQSFLESKGSYLANYTCLNAGGVYKKASEIIYDAAVNNFDCEGTGLSANSALEEKRLKCRPVRINPKMLLVLLQKEQSLIEEKSPSQRSLDWATGYGCPDNQACNTRWQGFGKQVNSAALQFFDYLTNPLRYTYKPGITYTITNTGRPSQLITPENYATAALYNYTPHVYNGNYNFHKLWIRYFTFFYLDGSLLQVKGEPGVWLIQGGKKRPIQTKGALTSRFDQSKILTVSQADLDRYPIGNAIKFPQYSLIRSPRGTIFLLVDDKRRGFTSQEAFRKMGYNPEEIIDAEWDDINTYEEIAPITATTSYPMGALLQDKTTGGIFYVFEGTKAPLWDKALLKTKFKRHAITPVSPEKLESFTTVEPAIFSDGELLKSPAGPGVYVIADKKKHSFVSGQAFEELGYKWGNIITVPDKILALYPDGEPIKEKAEIVADEEPSPDLPACTPDMGTSTPCMSSTTPPLAATSSPSTASTTEEIMEYYDQVN